MSTALYRKYRPKSLAEVVGQEHTTAALKTALAAKRFAHAYLLTGPRGVGKTTIARILAHEINGLPYSDESTHLDIIEIDAASNRRIDDIRELREKVHIAPTSAAYKVYIIDEVHMLTSESFNALLKTLEEPPEHAIFILATTELHKLPATIVSRTQRYNFKLIEPEELKKHLAAMAKKEKIEIDEAALDLIAEHGEGSFRDSISLLDQLAGTGKKLTASVVEDVLGLAPGKQIDALVESIKKGEASKAHDILYDFEKNGTSAASIVRQLTNALKKEALSEPALYKLIENLIDVPRSDNPRLKLLTVVLLYLSGETKEQPAKTTHAAAAAKPRDAVLEVSKVVPSKTVTNQATAFDFSPETWQAVLMHIKASTPPVYGVLKHAIPDTEQDGKSLVLGFGFPLHAKKIDDPKYRAVLGEALQTVAGANPEVIVKIDKSFQTKMPDYVPEPAKPAIETPPSGQTLSVLDMMGGGDVVNAPEKA